MTNILCMKHHVDMWLLSCHAPSEQGQRYVHPSLSLSLSFANSHACLLSLYLPILLALYFSDSLSTSLSHTSILLIIQDVQLYNQIIFKHLFFVCKIISLYSEYLSAALYNTTVFFLESQCHCKDNTIYTYSTWQTCF